MQPMASDAVELADDLVFTVTGRHLSDLQRTILRQVWQGRKYLDIARGAGYTEGHIKDVAYQLWKLLSRVTGEKVTKATLKSALKRYWQRLQPKSSTLAEAAEALQLHPISALANALGTAEVDREPGGTGGDASFVGRQTAMGHLNALISQGHRAIVIQGEGGLGKTTLAQHFVAQQTADLTLELLMAKDTADITPVEWVVEEWLRQDFGVEPGREFGVTLDRLRRHLRQQRVVVLIDNLEPCLDSHGKFVAPHRRYGELLRILTDSRSQTMTVLTSRDRLCEPGLSLTHYRLPGLDLAAWATYFGQRGLTVTGAGHPLEPVDPALRAMHSAYGGNAKAMELLCGTIQADFNGDLQAYWHIHHEALLEPLDLKNLVESQILRLRQLDPEAYHLFCRLGVYRYQDVPTIPLDGLLALMTEVSPSKHQAMIASLRNRSLLEHSQGHYWLHPVVREGAIDQLLATAPGRASWHDAHRSAARYWTNSVQRLCTLDDAIQALEAYYHYVAIRDFAAAARVILHSRDNQWRQFLPLGSTLYRMGLVQPVTDAITAVISQIPPHDSAASELNNILGDLLWIQGRIDEAIACQQNAIAIAQASLQSLPSEPESHRWYYLTMLVVDSQLSLGLYHLDLWDLDAAAAWFSQVITVATGTRHQPWADKATACLALVKTSQGCQAEAKALAAAVTDRVVGQESSGRHAFFVQMLGHTYLNLGDSTTAERLFQSAIQAAEAGHYLQIKANALSGLAQLEHRRHCFSAAVQHHRHAIALLQDVGAQCDLAAAHLQLALTLAQAPGDKPTAHHHADKAIQIFAAIPAPQQVVRVRQLFSQ